MVQGHTIRRIKVRLPVSRPCPRLPSWYSSPSPPPGKGSSGPGFSTLQAFKSHWGAKQQALGLLTFAAVSTELTRYLRSSEGFCIYYPGSHYKVMRQRRGCPLAWQELGEKLVPCDCEPDPQGLPCYGQTILEGANPAHPRPPSRLFCDSRGDRCLRAPGLGSNTLF